MILNTPCTIVRAAKTIANAANVDVIELDPIAPIFIIYNLHNLNKIKMEVMIIGFISGTVIVLGTMCGFWSLHSRLLNIETKIQETPVTRVIEPEINDWKSTRVFYPESVI